MCVGGLCVCEWNEDGGEAAAAAEAEEDGSHNLKKTRTPHNNVGNDDFDNFILLQP